ncbi:hypothetical protein FJT64_001758 [Amphibalanus amphitrite]|uniref:Uncharacterized protein n=1 Tax=Amphibalanus amphitrite TaxID=1232801 RepID=A0A6A4X5I5_AMPAM|nr:hypothetical protein FJT64_001758 [Amphibalanus amphitrite]
MSGQRTPATSDTMGRPQLRSKPAAPGTPLQPVRWRPREPLPLPRRLRLPGSSVLGVCRMVDSLATGFC